MNLLLSSSGFIKSFPVMSTGVGHSRIAESGTYIRQEANSITRAFMHQSI